jgi:hypothetical protein
MAPSPNRRELVLDNGKVVVDVPRLMTNDELVAVFEDFIAEVHGRPPKPPEPPKGSALAAASRPLPPHRYPKKRDSGLRRTIKTTDTDGHQSEDAAVETGAD